MDVVKTYPEATAYLNKIFDKFNTRFFADELPQITITIQSSRKNFGHFIAHDEVWDTPLGKTSEINISAEHLGDPIDEVAGTLLHEMVHFFNFLHHVKDCNKNGHYHNAKFRDAASSHGLVAKYDKSSGWSITSPSEELLEFISESQFTTMEVKRILPARSRGRTSSTRKYTCPRCGTSVRATKKVNIGCLTCEQKMDCEEGE